MSQPAPKLLLNTRKRHVRKGNQYHSGGWVQSPAMLDLFVAADWALTDIARRRGLEVASVEKVRLARLEGETRIYIYPTSPADPDGIEVVRRHAKIYINMIEFLVDEEQNLTIQTGYRERFDLPTSRPDESPVGWALCLDLSAPRERKPISRKKPTEPEPHSS